jgi:hypothetical protein
MQRLLVEKRGSKYIIKLYGIEYELVMPEEKKVVKKTKKKTTK